MRIVLIRHPKPLIEAGICYGRLDIPPHPSAEQQIGRIAANPLLYGAIWVWTSPALRCWALAGDIRILLPAAVRATVQGRLQTHKHSTGVTVTPHPGRPPTLVK
jgi:broad specificity phosphatase PhoE